MTPLEHRSEVRRIHKLYLRGAATLEDLYRAADAYIVAAVAHMKTKGKKFRPPSRAHIIRALT